MASAFPSFARIIASDLSRAAAARDPVGRSRLRRLLDVAIEPRRREVDRAAVRLIERSGGRLTDSLEREVGRFAAGLR